MLGAGKSLLASGLRPPGVSQLKTLSSLRGRTVLRVWTFKNGGGRYLVRWHSLYPKLKHALLCFGTHTQHCAQKAAGSWETLNRKTSQCRSRWSRSSTVSSLYGPGLIGPLRGFDYVPKRDELSFGSGRFHRRSTTSCTHARRGRLSTPMVSAYGYQLAALLFPKIGVLPPCRSLSAVEVAEQKDVQKKTDVFRSIDTKCLSGASSCNLHLLRCWRALRAMSCHSAIWLLPIWKNTSQAQLRNLRHP